jgi:hypothetical protein
MVALTQGYPSGPSPVPRQKVTADNVVTDKAQHRATHLAVPGKVGYLSCRCSLREFFCNNTPQSDDCGQDLLHPRDISILLNIKQAS